MKDESQKKAEGGRRKAEGGRRKAEDAGCEEGMRRRDAKKGCEDGGGRREAGGLDAVSGVTTNGDSGLPLWILPFLRRPRQAEVLDRVASARKTSGREINGLLRWLGTWWSEGCRRVRRLRRKQGPMPPGGRQPPRKTVARRSAPSIPKPLGVQRLLSPRSQERLAVAILPGARVPGSRRPTRNRRRPASRNHPEKGCNPRARSQEAAGEVVTN